MPFMPLFGFSVVIHLAIIASHKVKMYLHRIKF